MQVSTKPRCGVGLNELLGARTLLDLREFVFEFLEEWLHSCYNLLMRLKVVISAEVDARMKRVLCKWIDSSESAIYQFLARFQSARTVISVFPNILTQALLDTDYLWDIPVSSAAQLHAIV